MLRVPWTRLLTNVQENNMIEIEQELLNHIKSKATELLWAYDETTTRHLRRHRTCGRKKTEAGDDRRHAGLTTSRRDVDWSFSRPSTTHRARQVARWRTLIHSCGQPSPSDDGALTRLDSKMTGVVNQRYS